MQIYYSRTSPYSRKVRMVVLEKKLQHNVEELICNPFDEIPSLWAANPLGKVPTLITDTGDVLYDSPVICEYLDSLTDEIQLIPSSGMARWQVRRWEALTDGILDSAYNIVMERRRSPENQSQQWIQQKLKDITRAVHQINQDMKKIPENLSLAHLALGVTLGYLDFRLHDFAWRELGQSLANWYDAFVTRPSMIQTQPE